MKEASDRLDDAARAAWLAYVGGCKQDEIATQMGISRQAAQRLVAHAMAMGLVKVRIDHPMAHCMALASELKSRYGLAVCSVVPTLQSEQATGLAVSHAAGDLLESWLAADAPSVIGLGTGRTLRAAVEHLPHIPAVAHRIVSLTGNISPDGSTAYYNVLFTIADRVDSRTYPMPLPVIAASMEERDALRDQKTLATSRRLALETDVRFVGVGPIHVRAPLVMDGFITPEDASRLETLGAAGEILGFVFDRDGALVNDEINSRVTSTPLPVSPDMPTIAAAHGMKKEVAIRAALTGRLVTGLVTDERTAEALLNPANP